MGRETYGPATRPPPRATARPTGERGCDGGRRGAVGLLGGCGPGEDRVADLAARVRTETPTPDPGSTATPEAVRVEGTVESATAEAVVLDDGTGRAKLLAIGGFDESTVEAGECAWAEGFPTEPDPGEDVDVVVLVREVGLAE